MLRFELPASVSTSPAPRGPRGPLVALPVAPLATESAGSVGSATNGLVQLQLQAEVQVPVQVLSKALSAVCRCGGGDRDGDGRSSDGRGAGAGATGGAPIASPQPQNENSPTETDERQRLVPGGAGEGTAGSSSGPCCVTLSSLSLTGADTEITRNIPLAIGISMGTKALVRCSNHVYRNAIKSVSKRSAESVEMREMASRICRDYLHGAWKQITSRDIVLKRISGGLSNWLYHVSLPGGVHSPRGNEPSQVLLRLYGEIHGGEQGVEGLITESVIFTLLSERRLGPRLHGVFPGGRIEEYIPARPLKTAELADPKLSPLAAEKMAEIHSMNVPISKEPNWLWDTMNRWLQNVMVTLRDPAVLANNPDVSPIISRLACMDLVAEAKWLKKFLVRANSPVVFCHNDMQEGNILLVKECSPPRLVLIDFEYCSYNYRAFDLANHFLEWTYDYTVEEFPHFKACSADYPTPEQQLAFVRAYLQTARQQREHNCGGTIHALPPGQHPTDEEAALLKEVRAFTLASHFFWGLWSVVNATISQIPFGYWEYAEVRLNSYLEAKALLTSSSESVGVKRKTEDVD